MVSHRYRLIAWAALALLAGCASSTRVISTESRWPFEQLNLATPLGPAPIYVSKAATPRRLVVVVHTRPCATASDVLTTGGVIWQQFRDDAFVQLERPGTRATPESETLPCDDRRRSNVSDADWLRFDTRVIAAVRKREQLEAAPTVYLGVRGGAFMALTLALRDREAQTAILLAAVLTPEQVDRAVAMASAARTRVRITLVHPGADAPSALSAARSLFEALETRGLPAQMVELAELDQDFGLYAGKQQCFDLAAQIVGEQSHGVD